MTIEEISQLTTLLNRYIDEYDDIDYNLWGAPGKRLLEVLELEVNVSESSSDKG